MGSEHYCLRWNNHQSNLLGVFSQLLQDEALVDVTLACEGHSLRAHKVVLSACSAYFHGLFAAHPDRHPIVILHDAKFSELRTLVDFMYRGEVNVEYGRLSGLLRTAESLKVKGLAETTESSRGARPSPSILGAAASVTHVDEGDDACRPSPSATSAASPPIANPLPDSPPSPPATTSSGERRSHAARGECSPLGDNSPPRSKRSRGRHGSGGSGGSAAGDVRAPSTCHREPTESGDPTTEEVAAPSSPAPSPPAGEPIPGPSGLLLPVQRVPLSLKKEVDWDRASTDDKSGTGESSSEYRHPHDSDIPGEVVSKPSFISANIGDAADEAMMYSEQADHAAFAFSSHHISSKSSLLNPTPLHPSFSKQIPFSFNSNGNSSKSPQHPSAFNSKDEQHPEEQLSNQDAEPSIEPLLHHFLSSMSNFAYGGPTASPEPTPKSFVNDSKNDNASDYEDGNEEFYKHKGCNSFSVADGCADEHSANGEERAIEGESKEKPFRCDQCGQCYKYGSAYARHREQDHRARPPAEKPFRCESCGMRFRYLKSFKKHRLNHTLDRLRSKNYSSEEIILEEGNALHRLGKEEASGKDRKVVDSREKNEKDFTVNTERNESSRRRWPASLPDWKEQDGAESEDNAQVVTNPTSASTSEASQLWELLMRTSQDTANARENEDESSPKDGTGRPSLDCPFCGKSFRSRENLRLHVRKHTGERPFECSVCGRAFGGKSDMTRHLRIHTGERPYRCHVCTKRFARADYLSKHLTTHLH